MRRYCSNCGQLFEAASASHRYCGEVCLRASVPRGHFIILERDGFQCVYCGRSPLRDRALLAVDHIHPVSAGGDDRAINLVTCCRTCNSQKAGRVFNETLKRQLFAVIHDRNASVGISDNQRIDLGGTSASLRQDIEALANVGLDAIATSFEKASDPYHWLMAMAQKARVLFAECAADPSLPQAEIWALYDQVGLVMADIQAHRYRPADAFTTATEPMFDMLAFLEPENVVWSVGKDE